LVFGIHISETPFSEQVVVVYNRAFASFICVIKKKVVG